MMDYAAMGERIRAWRRERRLTQAALAEKVGISPSFLGHIERGTRIASLETIMDICRMLEVTPNELLGADTMLLNRELPEQVTLSTGAFLQSMAELLRRQQIAE